MNRNDFMKNIKLMTEYFYTQLGMEFFFPFKYLKKGFFVHEEKYLLLFLNIC